MNYVDSVEGPCPRHLLSRRVRVRAVSEASVFFDNITQITKEDDEIYGLVSDLHTIRPSLSLNAPDYKEILGLDICNWFANSCNETSFPN